MFLEGRQSKHVKGWGKKVGNVLQQQKKTTFWGICRSLLGYPGGARKVFEKQKISVQFWATKWHCDSESRIGRFRTVRFQESLREYLQALRGCDSNW